MTISFFAAAECFLRLAGQPAATTPTVGERQFVSWLSELTVTESTPATLFQDDDRLLWKLIPSTRIDTVNKHRAPQGEDLPIRITINDRGHRGPVVLPDDNSDRLRVLCLGDSNFFGYPLDDEHVFPRMLQRALVKLDQHREIEVVNGGVPGYSIMQGRRYFADSFAAERWDVLLLSFLNNDAWPQPHSDADLLRRHASPLRGLVELAGRSRLVRFGERLTAAEPDSYSSRVPLALFTAEYTKLVRATQAAGTRVYIIDFRAYPSYEPYSRALEKLAGELDLVYFPVLEHAQQALKDASNLRPYADLARQVHQRWGPLLEERSYLWMYAEYFPEHLNEVGTAWLADQIVPLILPENDECEPRPSE